MMLYSRQQLLVLLGLVAAAGLGLAVGQWRRAHPALVARLEDFDRDPEYTTAVLVPEPDGSRRSGAPRAVPPNGAPLDLNRASVAELARLPGVSAALAARIVEARERDGPFASVDDLARVRRLGRARVERLRPLLAVDEPAPGLPATDAPAPGDALIGE